MQPCPNCGQPVSPHTIICPNCGADTNSLWAAPPAYGAVQMDLTDLERRRGRDRIAMIVGFLLGLGLSCLIPFFLLGVIAAFVTYFCTRYRSPYFAKGMLYGGLAGVLGATLVCWSWIHPR